MIDSLLQEQIEYYRARAAEYEATALPDGGLDDAPDNPFAREWQDILQAVRALPQFDSILELACGTGLWTRELARHNAHLTALDAAPEMLAMNRANVNDSRVRYETADLFAWEPKEKYDLVFFAFWLSHVPDTLLDSFLERVRRALKPGGLVWIVDEPRDTKNVIPTQDNLQSRTLTDGRTFTIVKEYYDPAELAARLTALDFSDIEIIRGDYFFRLTALHP